MSTNSQNVTIAGSTFIHVERGNYNRISQSSETVNESNKRHRLEALKRLLDDIAKGAFHNSSERHEAAEPPKCHEGTRTSIQAAIMTWARDAESLRRLMWIFGPAGSGKSAIMQTIAELFEAEGILGASFFFFKSADKRNVKTHLIITLAYQLALIHPRFGDHFVDAIDNDPSIHSRNLATQMRSLIIDPMRAAATEDPNSANWLYLLLVDGLDECSPPESHEEIITLLVELAALPPFRVIIASRPEFIIRDTFSTDLLQHITHRVALDSEYRADSDIQLYVMDIFNTIKARHPSRYSIPNDWPETLDIEKLLSAASGQFIYAATVMKYINSSRHSPTTRLKVVLNARIPSDKETGAFSQLDALYHEILASQTIDTDEVLKILCCILFGHPGLKYANNLEAFLGYSRGELLAVLSDMHSLLNIPNDTSLSIKLYHTSLYDFIMDPLRSKHLYQSDDKIHEFLSTCFILRQHELVPKYLLPETFWYWFMESLRKASLTESLTAHLDDIQIYDARSFGNNTFTMRYKESGLGLVEGLDTFYQWLDCVEWESKTQLKKRLLDDLDRQLTQMVLHAQSSSDRNLIFHLIYMSKLDSISTSNDLLKPCYPGGNDTPIEDFMKFASISKYWEQKDRRSGAGFLHALKTVSNDVGRQTYQLIESLNLMSHFARGLKSFYLDLETIRNCWYDETSLSFGSAFTHWARFLRYFLPKYHETKHEWMESLDILIRPHVIFHNVFSVQVCPAYIKACTAMTEEGTKCTEDMCCHMKEAAIVSLKTELHCLALVVIEYLMRHNYQIDQHEYNRWHIICFQCQSSQEFLNDATFGQDYEFTFGDQW